MMLTNTSVDVNQVAGLFELLKMSRLNTRLERGLDSINLVYFY